MSTDGIALIDQHETITYVSPSTCRILGYETHELVGHNAFEWMHPEDVPRNRELLARLVGEAGSSAGSQYRYRHKDGSWRWLESIASNLLFAPAVGAFLLNYRDVSERKRTEDALAYALRERENIMETIPDVLYTTDRVGCLVSWNRKLQGVTGRAPDEIQGRSAVDFFSADEQPSVADAIQRAFAEGYAEVTAHIVRKDRSLVPYHFTGVPLRNERGAVIGLTGVGRDITERTRAEAELERLAVRVGEQARTLEGILSASPDHIYMIDRAGRFTYVSASGARALGRSSAEIVGKTSLELGLPATTVAAAAAQREVVFTTGQTISGDIQLPTVEGLKDFHYTLSPIRRDNGNVDAVVVTATDITERMQAERRTAVLLDIATAVSGTLDLDELFARVLRRTAEALPCDGVAVFHLDPVRQVTQMRAQYGVPAELLPAAQDLTFPPNQPFGGRLTRGETVVVNHMVQHAWVPRELIARFRIGALIAAPLLVRGRHLGSLVGFNSDNARPFCPRQVDLFRGIAGQLATAMQSAELYQAQQQESEVSTALAKVGSELIATLDTPVLLNRLCQLATEALPCDYSHVWLWRPKEVAYAVAAAYGEPPEHLEELRAVVVPRVHIARLLEELEQNGVVQMDMSSGNDPSILSALKAQYGITASLVHPLLRRGDILGLFTAGYRGRTDRFSPHQARKARGIAQLGSLALENAQLVEELESANRIKSDFVATMSHELRTPLNILLGYHDLLLDGAFAPLTAEQSDILRRANLSAIELLELITETLDVSRLESGYVPVQWDRVNLNDLLREISIEIEKLRSKKPAVRFAWRIGASVAELTTDALKLKVILKNLIVNALKFTEVGTVGVTVHSIRHGVEVRVADTGIGIAPDAQQTIFEAFRQVDGSSTRRYGGVGLGLYIVRRLVEILGGTVVVDSQPARGSVFRVWLPSQGRQTIPSRVFLPRQKETSPGLFARERDSR